MSATSTTFMPDGTLPGSGGTSAWVKPSRCASASRRCTPVTRLTSPARPTSPIATRLLGSGVSEEELATARAIARSAEGSESFTPPTVAV